MLKQHKGRLEDLGLIAMVFGILFLVQPLTLALYTIGFPILLAGFLFYVVVSHL